MIRKFAVPSHVLLLIAVGVLFLLANSGRSFAASAGQEEWERVLLAAKSEGKLSLIGPLGADRRDALTQGFQSKYGITVEYQPDAGAGIFPRLSNERKAGLYLWDVVISGTSTALDALIPNKFLEPLEPTLILPEVKDPKYWRGGALEFIDPGHQALIMTLFHRGTLYVNPNLVNAKEFTSHKDLLDPKWKGKIVADDPRKSGTGQGTFLFFYRHPELGAGFIRSLGRQDITFLKNYAQEVDMVGQGRFPVGIGLSDGLIEERTKRGVPIVILDPRQLKEGTPITPASGSLSPCQSSAPSQRRQTLHQLALVQRSSDRFFPSDRIHQQSCRCAYGPRPGLEDSPAECHQDLRSCREGDDPEVTAFAA